MTTQRATTMTRPANRLEQNRDEDWRLYAACRKVNPRLMDVDFGPGTSANVRDSAETAAKAVCAGCPVVDQCLADAYATGDRSTVRGGMTADERAADTKQKRPAHDPALDDPAERLARITHMVANGMTRRDIITATQLGRGVIDATLKQAREDLGIINKATPCGTDPGYQRHLRAGTTPCAPCRDAHNARKRAYAARKAAS